MIETDGKTNKEAIVGVILHFPVTSCAVTVYQRWTSQKRKLSDIEMEIQNT